MDDDLSPERMRELRLYAEKLARRVGWELTINPRDLLALIREVERRRAQERDRG